MSSTLLILPETIDHRTAVQTFLATLPTFVGITIPHPDVIEYNQDGTTLKITAVRSLISEAAYPPYQHVERCFVIYHLEKASLAAQQALLKISEEPPKYLQLLYTTSAISSILPTIRSRCQIELWTDNAHQPQDETKTGEIYQKICQSTPGGIVTLADTYKDRTEAQTLVRELIQYLEQQNQLDPTALRSKHLARLLVTLQRLTGNHHVQLTLEDCFFSFLQ